MFRFFITLCCISFVSLSSARTAHEYVQYQKQTIEQINQSYQQKIEALNKSDVPNWQKKFDAVKIQKQWDQQIQDVNYRMTIIAQELTTIERSQLDSPLKIKARESSAIAEIQSWRSTELTKIQLSATAYDIKTKYALAINTQADQRIAQIKQGAYAQQLKLMAVVEASNRNILSSNPNTSANALRIP